MFASQVFSPSTSTTQVPVATEVHLASLSAGLEGLMRQRDLILEFRNHASLENLILADASMNPTNAYKLRGALAAASAALQASYDTVVTASAGNHGAGVAYAAQLLGLRAKVFVPENAPKVKIQTIERFGAEVVKAGNNFDEALAAANSDALVTTSQARFIHPFDDPLVAAGQGTIGLELLRKIEALSQKRYFDKVRVYLPIGGGGMAAGVASCLKTLWNQTHSKIEIVGVIDESCPASLLGILFGRQIQVFPDTIADGTKVAMIGNTFLKVSHLLDSLIMLPHDEIVSAMRNHFNSTGVKLEGAGALSIAGQASASRYHLFGDTSTNIEFALVSGRNVDAETFDQAISSRQRIDPAFHQRVGYDVVLREEAGELLRFLHTMKNFNIASLTYRQDPTQGFATVRTEFEVPISERRDLDNAILGNFRGSVKLSLGEQIKYKIGKSTAFNSSNDLIRLEDRPGSFLDWVTQRAKQNNLGDVNFLFYRKPSRQGIEAQVVLGRKTALG